MEVNGDISESVESFYQDTSKLVLSHFHMCTPEGLRRIRSVALHTKDTHKTVEEDVFMQGFRTNTSFLL